MTVVTPPRVRKPWDIVLSIVFLVFAYSALLVGGFFQFFVLAFTDSCPTGCDIESGVNAVFAVGLTLVSLTVAATIAVIVLLVTRRRAWWVAVALLVLTIAGWIVSFTLYVAAVSPG